MPVGRPRGAQFEISVDGKPRSYRDIKETAIEGAEYLKQHHPHSEVTVKDLESGEVTVAAWKGRAAVRMTLKNIAPLSAGLAGFDPQWAGFKFDRGRIWFGVSEAYCCYMTASGVRDLECPSFHVLPRVEMTLLDHLARHHERMPNCVGVAAKRVSI